MVLTNELLSTHDMLNPFEPWGNCSIHDVQFRSKGPLIRNYYPMDSDSLRKSENMPAVGALYPKIFAERGYWWWKAQEISYALRPTYDTLKSVQRKYKDSLYNMAVFQLRRTDKVHGCATVYGTVFSD